MEKIWLKSYPSHIPAIIEIPPLTLVDIFDTACAQHADKNAFSSFNKTISYQETAAQVKTVAAYFQQKLKLAQGDRIAIMLPNILQFPVVFFAALQAGLVIIPVNPMYTERELALQLKDARVSAIVILSEMAHKLESVLTTIPIAHVIITNFTDCLDFPQALFINFYLKYIKKAPDFKINNPIFFKEIVNTHFDFNPVSIKTDDLALIQYTGGTTGLPKGVMLTHANIVANVYQTKAWVEEYINTAQDKFALAPLPLYHIFSLMANNILLMSLGFENILIADPRHINNLIKILRKRPLVLMTGVNTLYNALLASPKFKHLDFKHQKVCLAGGMTLQKSVAKQWKDVTGKTLIEAYGLTESSPAAIINPLDLIEYNGAMGLPLPNTDIRICDDKGREVEQGSVGELWIQGPQVSQGYWHNTEETKISFTNGWLKTGDLVKMDANGYIYFVDRKKDMIVVSGFNVYPTEIEHVLTMHKGVSEAAVIGIPDPIHGEKIKCFVVKKDPHLTEQQLREYLHHELTGYKRPEIIEFCDALPKTAVGKVLHRALKVKHENTNQ